MEKKTYEIVNVAVRIEIANFWFSFVSPYITLFRFISVFYRIMSVTHNIVMDLNNVKELMI